MENFIVFNFCKDKKSQQTTDNGQQTFLIRNCELGIRSFGELFYLKKFSK